MAEIIQHDVLPQWRSGTEPFVTMNHVSKEQAKYVSTIRDYVQARRKSWERLVEAIRENNPEKEVLSKRHAAAAERVLDKLTQ